MNRYSPKVFLLITVLAVILAIIYLSPKTGFASVSENISELSSWIGNYEFGEFCPPNMVMAYSITIYKEIEDYYANIYIDGFQTLTRIKAKVIGNEKTIKFVFDEYLPENMWGFYKKDDVLLVFDRENSVVYTHWEELKPMLPENEAPNKVYFVKTEIN